MADFSRDFQVAYDDECGSCTIRFRCFDTPNSVTLYGLDFGKVETEDLLLEVRRTCLDYHRLWSFNFPKSDISRMNETVERVQVDERTARLVEAMKAFNAVEPSFDFTIGPVSFLWKHAASVPSDERITEALSHVGAGNVEVDGATVIKHDPAARIDVGGAAKGFVADELVAALRERGVERADIDLGGNLFLTGDHPSGRPWRVKVRIPEGFDVVAPIIEIENRSTVTSGSYERFVEIDGTRYQHIIDARTGWPCESDVVSATVVSSSSLEADLLATTACLVGSAGLDELSARHPACRFIVLTSAGDLIDIQPDALPPTG